MIEFADNTVMNKATKVTNKYVIEICVVGLTILLFLFRTSIPFFKYPFLLLVLGLIIFTLINYRNRIRSRLKEFVNNYYLLLLLAIVLIISILLSNKLYLLVFKDAINLVILFSLFFIMSLYINSKSDLNLFLYILIKLIIFFALLITVVSLYNLINIFPGNRVYYANELPLNISTERVEMDYNFAILPVIFGMIGLFYFMVKSSTILEKFLYNLLLLIFSVNIFFSGSRRGLFTLVIIAILLLLSHLFHLFRKNSIIGKIGSVSLPFLLSLGILSVFIWYFTFNTSYVFKNKTLKFIGSKSIDSAKKNISMAIFRYNLIKSKSNNYSDIYNIIWSPVFNPKDPDSNWGIRVHKTIYPLTGENIGIVPRDSKGYLMDSTCNADTWDGNAFSFSYIGNKIEVDSNYIIQASVYCYVSEDFNGSWARIISGGQNLGIINGNNYDLLARGTWQKLTCNVNCDKKDEVDVLLYFSKSGVTDFTTLKGHIIFAYPQVEVISNSDSLLSCFKCNDLIYKNIKKCNTNKNQFSGVEVMHDKNYPDFHKEIDMDHRYRTINFSETRKLYTAGTLNLYLPIVIGKLQKTIDHDPIRNFVSRIISEDTTYYGFKSELFVDTITNKFIENRVMRWEFALQIFEKEYNWQKKIFGGGFNFLNWYGYYFMNDKTQSDYPHNPFLYILLYSGIFGLTIYLFFIFKVFKYYFRYLKEYPLIFIFFMITFFFTFFSGGTPFDPPMMGFFVILPFFINSIYRKDIIQQRMTAT
jgi:hypothetical protein